MNRALIVKELRECAPILALAAAALALLLCSAWGVRLPWDSPNQDDAPFYSGDFTDTLTLLAMPLAAIVALRQSYGEEWGASAGTFYYLWARPIARRRVIALKMIVGLATVMGVIAAAILLHGLWAATPGRNPFPFFWSMTLPTWKMWSTLPLVYSTALLSGLRPGRWIGSKLLPLAGGGAVTFILCVQPWGWIAAAVSAAGTALALWVACEVVESRDY
jgi:hypothetical protein